MELKKFLECGAARESLTNLSFKIQTVRKMGAPIYWSGASIYWSPKIFFSIFWKGMKWEGYDKTRFCVSREGLLNVTGTFRLPWFMWENKTKKCLFWQETVINAAVAAAEMLECCSIWILFDHKHLSYQKVRVITAKCQIKSTKGSDYHGWASKLFVHKKQTESTIRDGGSTAL